MQEFWMSKIMMLSITNFYVTRWVGLFIFPWCVVEAFTWFLCKRELIVCLDPWNDELSELISRLFRVSDEFWSGYVSMKNYVNNVVSAVLSQGHPIYIHSNCSNQTECDIYNKSKSNSSSTSTLILISSDCFPRLIHALELLVLFWVLMHVSWRLNWSNIVTWLHLYTTDIKWHNWSTSCHVT